jgi:hypothetical protein
MKEFIITFVAAMFITAFFNGISFEPAVSQTPLTQNTIQQQDGPAPASNQDNTALLKHGVGGS